MSLQMLISVYHCRTCKAKHETFLVYRVTNEWFGFGSAGLKVCDLDII